MVDIEKTFILYKLTQLVISCLSNKGRACIRNNNKYVGLMGYI